LAHLHWQGLYTISPSLLALAIRIISISVASPKASTSMMLSMALMPTNAAYVNEPLHLQSKGSMTMPVTMTHNSNTLVLALAPWVKQHKKKWS